MAKTSTKNKLKIVYQCGEFQCCPVVKQKGNTIFIEDDYNNTVKMTKKQWDELIGSFSKNKK